MKQLVWALIVMLILLRQDIWFWDDPALVFGFLPTALLFHAGISLGAAFAWYLATRFCWPDLSAANENFHSEEPAS